MKNIIDNSTKNNFYDCSNEWELNSFYYDREKLILCQCNYPLMYVINIKNKNNGLLLSIGEDCCKRFMPHLEIGFFFNGLKSCKNYKIPNIKFLDYLRAKEIITKEEYIDFLKSKDEFKIVKYCHKILYKIKGEI